MATTHANGINITYEIDGSGPPLLLVMGLGGQLTDWPTQLVDRLAEHFTVVRFDNRDIGLSDHMSSAPPSRLDFLKAIIRPSWANAAYDLSDMAADAAGLLDALDLDDVHVVGMSMGGMIAQVLAIGHGTRVRSLCSIMSNTGNQRTGRPTPRVFAHLARQDQDSSKEAAVARTLDLFSLVCGSDWDRDQGEATLRASLERSYNPAGVLRQSLAIAVSPDRTERLTRLQLPSLVIHGLEDTLVRPSGGVATAEAIPDSRLLMFPRMGHDLPATRHAEMVDAIVSNSQRALATV
jgi:pimeloyl-ACP methyl ester carboxylesterase